VAGTTVPVVSLAFLATVWTASRAVKVVLVAISIAYGEEQPTGFGQRILGFGLTLVGIVAGLVMAPLLIVGPGSASSSTAGSGSTRHSRPSGAPPTGRP
jgi:uncharacterized BrkB/YihY/UPF0761 family membrane protein